MSTRAFKTSDYLKTQKDVVAYLNAALEDGEPAVLLRPPGMAEVTTAWMQEVEPCRATHMDVGR